VKEYNKYVTQIINFFKYLDFYIDNKAEGTITFIYHIDETQSIYVMIGYIEDKDVVSTVIDYVYEGGYVSHKIHDLFVTNSLVQELTSNVILVIRKYKSLVLKDIIEFEEVISLHEYLDKDKLPNKLSIERKISNNWINI
jgi:hypothetical protein